MAKNTTHKYWFWFYYGAEQFYFAVPIKDYEAQILICRVGSAFNAITGGCLFSDFPAVKAYADIRKGVPARSFDYALSLWKEILPRYYTKEALDTTPFYWLISFRRRYLTNLRRNFSYIK